MVGVDGVVVGADVVVVGVVLPLPQLVSKSTVANMEAQAPRATGTAASSFIQHLVRPLADPGLLRSQRMGLSRCTDEMRR